MRNGVYALLAVVMGVMLIGLLPGQLSHLAAPTAVMTTSLQSRGAPESTSNTTSTQGTNYLITNTTGLKSSASPADPTGDAETAAQAAAQAAQTKADAASTEGAFTFSGTHDPYADVKYYGLWGVGLVAALTIYFVAKRMLG
jgi:hypothetical protein